MSHLVQSHSCLSVFVRCHSVASEAGSSQHSSHNLAWDYRHSSTNLQRSYPLSCLQASFAFAHAVSTPSTHLENPTLLPSPDVVISCEAFCSPSPPPSLVSAVCSTLRLTTLGGGSFLRCCFPVRRALWEQRGSLGCLVDLRLDLAFRLSGAQRGCMEGTIRSLAAL